VYTDWLDFSAGAISFCATRLPDASSVPCHLRLRCRRNRVTGVASDIGDRRGNGAISHVLFLWPFVRSPAVYDTVRRVQGVVPWRVSVHGICVQTRDRNATSVFSRDFPRTADGLYARNRSRTRERPLDSLTIADATPMLRCERCFVDDNITCATRRSIWRLLVHAT